MDDVRYANLLLALVRRDWDRARQLAAEPEPIAGATFAEVCRLSDVHGWMHQHLKQHDAFDIIGPEATAALQSLRMKSRMDNLLVLGVGMQAIDAMLERDVTVVALKGLDWLHRFYDPFDTRAIDDIDVLVPSSDLVAALDGLQASGFALPPEPKRTAFIRGSHHLPVQSTGQVPVDFELHWNLAQDGRYSIDADGLVERSLPLDVDGRALRRLDDHDAAAHILVHHLSHYFDRRLKWLIDLGHLVQQPGFDWSIVLARLDEWGALAAGAGALAHLHKLSPEIVPADVVRRLPLSTWRKLATAPLRSKHPLELYRNTRNRRVQLMLAAAYLERPLSLPGWLWHRMTRDDQGSDNPLDFTSEADVDPARPASSTTSPNDGKAP